MESTGCSGVWWALLRRNTLKQYSITWVTNKLILSPFIWNGCMWGSKQSRRASPISSSSLLKNVFLLLISLHQTMDHHLVSVGMSVAPDRTGTFSALQVCNLWLEARSRYWFSVIFGLQCTFRHGWGSWQGCQCDVHEQGWKVWSRNWHSLAAFSAISVI